MTNIVTTHEPALGYYQDKPVTDASLEVRGTGSGLDKSLHLPQLDLAPGTYDVVFRCTLDKHRHELNDDGESWTLVYLMKADAATIPDPGQAADSALDTAEERIAARRAAEEERKRAEKGEEPLPFPDNGEPQQVGDVLDAAIDLAQVAEHTTDWRQRRTRDLDAMDKPTLLTLADDYGIPGRTKMLKAELVDALADHEEQHGGGA